MNLYLSLTGILLISSHTYAINRSNNSLITNKNNLNNSGQTAQPRGHESWYHDGYGSDYGYGGVSGKQADYYWLIPLVIVIGFGALLLPLLGTLMTTLITQGTLTMTAGRKKRDIDEDRLQMVKKPNYLSESIISLLTKFEEAVEKFANMKKQK